MIDIVIQGGLWDITLSTAERYKDHPLVNNVIISTWEDEPLVDYSDIIFNKLPDNPGPCNINLQLISSKNGLLAATSDFVIKTRSDQRLSYKDISIICDKVVKTSKINIIGMSPNFPYHPQDHLFAGSRPELLKLFSTELSSNTNYRDHNPYSKSNHKQRDLGLEWNYSDLRPNIYIGAGYLSTKDSVVFSHFGNKTEYLTDLAPKRHEALNHSMEIMMDYFSLLPRLDIFWAKQQDGRYPYEAFSKQGEVYGS